MPKKPDPDKDKRLDIRTSDNQKDLWRKAASLDRRNLSDWIRSVLDTVAEAKLLNGGRK